MAVKLVNAPGTVHLKSQDELNTVFATVSAAATKQLSADASQALAVYNKVVADGRFVKQFATDPGGAAQKLGLKLSPAQAGRIQEVAGISAKGGKGGVLADDVELVAVAIIVLVLADVPDRDIVVDTTGIIKA